MQKTQSNLFRDSQGRFRREDTTSTSLGQSKSSVVINDPVAGTSFVLHRDQKTAEQLAKPFVHKSVRMNFAPQDETTHREQTVLDRGNVKTEDLGTQTIAGFAVQGRRVTMRIAAGQSGNENLPAVVLETWYSKDLHFLMMSKRNDPWSGETTYQITNVQPTEPDPSLFAVPGGYTVHSLRH